MKCCPKSCGKCKEKTPSPTSPVTVFRSWEKRHFTRRFLKFYEEKFSTVPSWLRGKVHRIPIAAYWMSVEGRSSRHLGLDWAFEPAPKANHDCAHYKPVENNGRCGKSNSKRSCKVGWCTKSGYCGITRKHYEMRQEKYHSPNCKIGYRKLKETT